MHAHDEEHEDEEESGRADEAELLGECRVDEVGVDVGDELVAVGLTFGFALQTFIIVGGILRLIPLTGITLPFVSAGSSSVWTGCWPCWRPT